MGRASVIHQVATQILEAKIALPSMGNVSGLIMKKKKMNNKGPKTKPIVSLEGKRSEFFIEIR